MWLWFRFGSVLRQVMGRVFDWFFIRFGTHICSVLCWGVHSVAHSIELWSVLWVASLVAHSVVHSGVNWAVLHSIVHSIQHSGVNRVVQSVVRSVLDSPGIIHVHSVLLLFNF